MRSEDPKGQAKVWFTVGDAARHAAVGRQTIYDACLTGDLKHARIGGRRAIRLRPEWVDAWIEGYARAGIPDGRIDLLGE